MEREYKIITLFNKNKHPKIFTPLKELYKSEKKREHEKVEFY
jgi:hypothetical protein